MSDISYQHPISPIICPNVRGRIREGEEDRDTNLREERKRSRSPRGRETIQKNKMKKIKMIDKIQRTPNQKLLSLNPKRSLTRPT